MPRSMSHVDHFWLSMDGPINCMVITALMAYEAPLACEPLRETVEQRARLFFGWQIGRYRFSRKRPYPLKIPPPTRAITPLTAKSV